MNPTTRWILIPVAVLLAIVLVGLNVALDRRDAADPADGGAVDLNWREVLAWDFADGEFPDGWGWGQWVIRDGYLELRDPTGDEAVYFTPVEHAPDFMMVTEFMLVSDLQDGATDSESVVPVSAHLLTRDTFRMTHESGCTVRAGRDSLSVRHKVNLNEYLLDIVPSEFRLERGRWYRLRFTVARGEVSVHLDGRLVFASDDWYPQGMYAEPHLAAESGVVRFRSIRVFDAERASGPVYPRNGGRDVL